MHAKFNGRSKWLTPETTLSDYIHKYAPKSDGTKPVEYTEFMAKKFNQVLGEDVITKDTPVVDIKEALMEAGLDPEHTITQAHLSMENPRVLKDLGIVYGEGAIDRKPMPAVRQTTGPTKTAPKTPVTYNPNPTLGLPDLYPNAAKKQEPKAIIKPTPAATKPSTPSKPLTRAETAKKVKQTFNVDLTSEQLDIATNPKLTTTEKLVELGFMKQPKTIDSREERGTITKIWDSLFGEDAVPLEVTQQARSASKEEDLREETEVKNVASPLASGAKAPAVKIPTKETSDVNSNKRKQNLDVFATNKGFKKITDKLYRGKSYNNIDQGTFSRAMIDMSDGIVVAYQPRNQNNANRSDVDNALIVSDYLYDYDFIDNYENVNAALQNTKLKEGFTTEPQSVEPVGLSKV